MCGYVDALAASSTAVLFFFGGGVGGLMREAAFVFSLPSSLGGLCGFMLVEEAAVVNDTRPKVPCGHRKLFFLLIFKKNTC